MKLGKFQDNVAHSAGRYGLRIFDRYIPRTYPCKPVKSGCNKEPYKANPSVEAVFENTLTYKNLHNGFIGEHLGAITFKNMTSISNNKINGEISSSDESPDMTARIIDSKIVGHVEEIFEKTWK